MSVNPYKLAQSLGKPVARGQLLRDAALASLVNVIAEMDVEPPLERGAILRFSVHFLDDATRRLGVAITMTRARIRRLAWQMIEQRAHSGALFAEAHNLNADDGSPMSEDAVNAMVMELMRQAVRRNG